MQKHRWLSLVIQHAYEKRFQCAICGCIKERIREGRYEYYFQGKRSVEGKVPKCEKPSQVLEDK